MKNNEQTKYRKKAACEPAASQLKQYFFNIFPKPTKNKRSLGYTFCKLRNKPKKKKTTFFREMDLKASITSKKKYIFYHGENIISDLILKNMCCIPKLLPLNLMRTNTRGVWDEFKDILIKCVLCKKNTVQF